MPTRRSAAASRDAELVDLLFGLTDRLRHRYEAVASAHGLTRQQATLLALVEQPTPMSALAVSLQCDASNVTGLVDRLERTGLVLRQRDGRDRRVTTVAATEEGSTLHRRFEADLYSDGLPFDALSAGERSSLLTLLRRMG